MHSMMFKKSFRNLLVFIIVGNDLKQLDFMGTLPINSKLTMFKLSCLETDLYHIFNDTFPKSSVEIAHR